MIGRLIPIDRRPSGWRRWLLDLPWSSIAWHLDVLLGCRFVVVVVQRFLSEAHAARAMRAYIADHPATARVLGSWMSGSDFDGSPEAVGRLVARVPFVAFRPAPSSGDGERQPGLSRQAGRRFSRKAVSPSWPSGEVR